MIAATPAHPDTSPGISEAAVKIALDTSLEGLRAQGDRSLENLLLVDEILMDAAFPPARYRRAYAVSQLLSSVIAEELRKLRSVFGIQHVNPDDSLEAAKQAIGRDKQIASAEILGWSWLYYHYVRVDLKMSRDRFCQLASIDLRTLQRYQQSAIGRLTTCLMEREWHLRKEWHRRRLYTRLPTMTSHAFCGREDVLKHMREMYGRLRLHHFQILGEAGIGKTAFVQKAVRSLIDSDSLDELIWFEAPVSARQIEERLDHFLGNLGVAVSIREYTQSHRVAFVFDGIDQWKEDGKTLETLLSDLGAGIVFLTSRAPLPLRVPMGHIVLQELSIADAKHLIHKLLNNWYLPCFEPTSLDVQSIWEQVGGNPHLILQAVFDFQSQHIQIARNCPR